MLFSSAAIVSVQSRVLYPDLMANFLGGSVISCQRENTGNDVCSHRKHHVEKRERCASDCMDN